MTANTLHAFFELDIAPPGFNILPFLGLADIERERQGLEHVHLVIVPGTTEGFRDLDFRYPVYNKEWRKRQIVISSASLLPSLNGLTVCATREEAAQVETVIAKTIFPCGYSVAAPLAHHKYIYLMEAFAEGIRVDRLVSSGQPRIYAKQWLDGVARGRKVVSISLRESNYDIHRNSNLANWGDFGRWLEKEGYCPVIVRDTEMVFDPMAPELEGLPYFPFASVNTELRAALYAECYLNTGINHGAENFWYLMRDLPYLAIHTVDRLYVGGKEDFLDYYTHGIGITVGENYPFARFGQMTFWGDDHLEDIKREFNSLVESIEAGSADREPEPAFEAEKMVALARRHHERGELRHARELYRRCLAEDPDDLQAMYLLGTILRDLGEYDEAIKQLSTALERSGPIGVMIAVLADALVKSGNHDKAVSILQAGLDSEPEDADLYEAMGDTLQVADRNEEAIPYFESALRLNGEAEKTRLKMADLWLSLGEGEKAASTYASVLLQDHTHPSTLERLARALEQCGRSRDAVRCYQLHLAAATGNWPGPELQIFLENVSADHSFDPTLAANGAAAAAGGV